jgi:hypothetical protein
MRKKILLILSASLMFAALQGCGSLLEESNDCTFAIILPVCPDA